MKTPAGSVDEEPSRIGALTRHDPGGAEAAIAAYRPGPALVPDGQRFTAFILFCPMRVPRDAGRFRAADRDTGVNPEGLVADRSARALMESELEFARRGDFVRPLRPGPAAPPASIKP